MLTKNLNVWTAFKKTNYLQSSVIIAAVVANNEFNTTISCAKTRSMSCKLLKTCVKNNR